jgi:Fibronectin type III domain
MRLSLFCRVLFCLLVFQGRVWAQINSVATGHLTITNPTAQLADFANPNSPKLQLNLQFLNLDQQIPFRLKMTLERGNTLLAYSASVVQTFTASSATPLLTIQPSQLTPYFQLANLQGISPTVYNTPLGDGSYRITFELLDTRAGTAGQALSAPISQQFWLTMNDPPLLNAPADAENVASLTANTPIRFEWIPRQTPPNTQYVFTLVDLGSALNSNANVFQQFLAAETNPKHRQNTGISPFLSYDGTRPALTVGNTYAWRVQAIVSAIPNALVAEQASFKNDGYSEIFTFKYQGNCAPVSGLTLTPRSPEIIEARWTAAGTYNNYRVFYRKTGNTAYQWFEKQTTNASINLTTLEASTEYEVKIGGVCGSGLVGFSPVMTARTQDSIANGSCGTQPAAPANGVILDRLNVNDVIYAADFPVTITRVTSSEGSTGVYSGEGVAAVPYMGTKIKVKFSSITLHTVTGQKRLIGGNIESVYDPTWGNILSIDGITEGGNNVGIVRTGLAFTEFNVDFPILNVNNIVVTNLATGGATIRFTGTNGNLGQAINSGSLPTSIKDSEGRVYGIDKNGRPVYVGRQGGVPMSSGELNTLSLDKGVATFTGGGFYAFDAYNAQYENDILWKSKYEKRDTYGVGNKASAPGKPDVINVSVRFNNDSFRMDSVKFITSKGMNYASRHIGNGVFEVPLVGAPGADAQELYALHPKTGGKYWSLGKLFVPSYTIQKRKLVLVPVKGTRFDKNAIAAQVNAIYNPVCVEWIVEDVVNFQDSTWDANNNGLDVKGSGFFSGRTAEMKALNKAYKKKYSTYSDAAYIFVLNHASDTLIKGDMPRSNQFGYLFTDNNHEQGKVTAHEVAHGMFNLKHTFTDYSFTQSQLQDNLMNYDTGVKFSKYQWDQIHDIGFASSLFDDDEDAYFQNLVHNYFRFPSQEDETVPNSSLPHPTSSAIGLTPDGYPILSIHSSFDVFGLISTNVEVDAVVERHLYVITGFRVKKLIGNDTNTYVYKAAYDVSNKFLGYALNGMVPADGTGVFKGYTIATRGVAPCDYMVSIRQRLNHCQYLVTQICWAVPNKPLLLSKVIENIKKKLNTNERVWKPRPYDNEPCGKDKFKRDFGNSGGTFYSGNDFNAQNLINDINGLVEELMPDTMTYNKYIINVLEEMRDNSHPASLDMAELQDLYNSLELLKLARIAMNKPLMLIDDIITWINTCNSSNSQHCQVSDNLVPRCLWDHNLLTMTVNNEELNPFSLAKVAGVVDGAYQTVKGIGELGNLMVEFSEGTGNFFDCWLHPLQSGDETCKTTRQNTKAALSYLKNLMSNPEARKGLLNTLEDFKAVLDSSYDNWKAETFLDSGTSQEIRCSQYKQGKLVFDIASCFFGVGEFKMLSTGGTFFSKIATKLTDVNLLFSKLRAATWIKLAPIVGTGQRIITGLALMAHLGPLGAPIKIGEFTARAATISHVVDRSAKIERALQLTAPLSTTPLSVSADLERAVLALKGTAAQTELGAIALEVGRVEKALGPVSFIKMTDNSVVILDQTTNQILAQIVQTSVGSVLGAIIHFVQSPPPPIPSGACNFCRTSNLSLCQRLKAMNERYLDPDDELKRRGITKLCNSFPDGDIGDAKIIAILDALDPIVEAAFLKDISSDSPSEHIGANVSFLNANKVDAWKIVWNARSNLKYHQDYKVICQTALLMGLTDYYSMLGNKEGLTTIINRNQWAPCYTCDHSNQISTMRKMNEYLEDIFHAQFYKDKDNFEMFVASLKDSEENNIIGSAFEVKTLAADIAFASQVRGFEVERDSRLENLEWRKRYSDIVYRQNLKTIYVDCKSVNSNFFIFELNLTMNNRRNETEYKSKYNQFLDYLLVIEAMDELEYWFDKEKLIQAGILTENAWKQVFQTQLLRRQVDNVTGNNFTVADKIFEIIWNRGTLELRRQLFQGNTTNKTVAQNIFSAQIRANVNNNLFFNFIKFK